MREYSRPETIEGALAALKAGRPTIIAGGTDFYPARVGRPLDEDILDISGIAGLRGIEERRDHWRIGAAATWRDLARAELPPLFDGLKLAAREVGGVQIQSAGTVGGNLCNASPAADGAPALLSLDAAVELADADGRAPMALDEFLIGNRRTLRRPDQLLTAIIVPKPAAPRAGGHFLKLGARRYLVISIVMVGAAVAADDQGTVTTAGVAVGACAATARRLPALEAALVGRPVGDGLGAAVEAAHLRPLAPIDDARGSADYRLDAALTLTRRALDELGARL